MYSHAACTRLTLSGSKCGRLLDAGIVARVCCVEPRAMDSRHRIAADHPLAGAFYMCSLTLRCMCGVLMATQASPSSDNARSHAMKQVTSPRARLHNWCRSWRCARQALPHSNIEYRHVPGLSAVNMRSTCAHWPSALQHCTMLMLCPGAELRSADGWPASGCSATLRICIMCPHRHETIHCNIISLVSCLNTLLCTCLRDLTPL